MVFFVKYVIGSPASALLPHCVHSYDTRSMVNLPDVVTTVNPHTRTSLEGVQLRSPHSWHVAAHARKTSGMTAARPSRVGAASFGPSSMPVDTVSRRWGVGLHVCPL